MKTFILFFFLTCRVQSIISQQWNQFGSCYWDVWPITPAGNSVYVGGGGPNPWCNLDPDVVARWDTCQWSAMPGVNGYVNAIAVSGNDVFIGGGFTQPFPYLARWDGTQWNSVGSQPIGPVSEILIDGPNLIIAGESFVSQWNGSSWETLGSFNDAVRSLAKDGNFLYAGGDFTDAGGNPDADGIAMYNGTSWNNLGTPGSDIEILDVLIFNGELYVAGCFEDIGGNPDANSVAKWDGSNWIGLNFPSDYCGLSLTEFQGTIFSGAGNNSAYAGIYEWDAGAGEWELFASIILDVGPGWISWLAPLASDADNLYVGMDFWLNGEFYPGMARWGQPDGCPSCPTLNATGEIINPLCAGSATGSINVTPPNNGSPPYSYNWSNGATTEDISGLSAINYFLTITDGSSCTSTFSFALAEPPEINLNIIAQPVSCNGEGDGELTAIPSGGVPGYGFQWSNGANAATINNLEAGTYTVTVTDENDCTLSASYQVEQPAQLEISLVNLQNESCESSNDGEIAISIGGGINPYNIQWSNGANAATINDLEAGTYTVTVTDENDCTQSASYQVEQPAQIEISVVNLQNESCESSNDGEITISIGGGINPYNVQWSNGNTGTTISGLTPGVYSVTITDNNTCTQTVDYTILPGIPVEINLVQIYHVSCAGETDGSVSVAGSSGNPPYVYLWSTGETVPSISNLSAGTYTITITDNNGCTQFASYQVDQPAELEISLVNLSNLSCVASNDGEIEISIGGGINPYNVQWSNGNTGTTISDLAPGGYSVTITDNNDCIQTAEYLVNEPLAITAQITQSSQNQCAGDSTAGLSAMVSGGTSPLAALWSNGITGFENLNLGAGIYSVTITDANACVSILSDIITEPQPIYANTMGTNETGAGANNGTAISNPTGGVPPFSFLWNTGDTLSELSGLSPGTYTVTITDANGCTAEGTALVNAFGCALDIMPGADLNICEEDTLAIQPSVIGGSGTLSYIWSDGSTGESLSVHQGGVYCVTITDSFNCQDLDCVEITEIIIPPITCPVTDESIPGANDGSIHCDSFPGIIAYLWSNDSITSSIIGLSPGQYCVTLTEQNGCLATQCFYVQPGNCQMVVDVYITDILCAGSATGKILLVATNGTAPITYTWSTGETTAGIENLSPGSYAVTISDASGCVNLNSFNISEPLPLTVVIDSIAPADKSGSGLISISVAGGVPPYTYQWTDPLGVVYTTEDLDNLAEPGLYSLMLVDDNGCVLDSIYVDMSVAVKPSPSFESIKVYPVPAKNLLIIDTDKPITEVWISGVDGRVYKRIIRPESSHLDIADLGPGWYLLRIRSGNAWHVARVVK